MASNNKSANIPDENVAMQSIDDRMKILIQQHKRQKELSEKRAILEAKKAKSNAIAKPIYKHFIGPRVDRPLFIFLGIAAFFYTDYTTNEPEKRLIPLVSRWWQTDGIKTAPGRFINSILPN